MKIENRSGIVHITFDGDCTKPMRRPDGREDRPEWLPSRGTPYVTADEKAAIRAFAAEVNRRAEEAILAGGPMEGAHMRAMRETLKEIER